LAGSRFSARTPLNGAGHDGTGTSRSSPEFGDYGSPSVGSRSIPEETAVALTYNGGTYAVMMTTPRDLEDFAVGFSLSEGVISSSADIDSLDIVPLDEGVELRMWLTKPKADRLRERRRHIAGPTGCGLCGIESIAEGNTPRGRYRVGRQFSPEQIMVAMQSLRHIKSSTSRRARYMPRPSGIPRAASLPCARTLAAITPSTSCRVHWRVHPLWRVRGSFFSPAEYQLSWCKKSAAIGAPIMCRFGANRAGVRTADAAGITLAAIARADGFEVFTHPRRISLEAVADVAACKTAAHGSSQK